MATSVSSSSAPEGPKGEAPIDRGAARCVHFGECGGCQIQNLEYKDQLTKKGEILTALIQPLGWAEPITVRPSPEPWYYRNKMEFSFQDIYPAPPLGQDHLLLGLKRKKRWDKVMNLTECFLMSPEAPKLLASVHAWGFKENLEPYNLHKQVGFLRHLVVREGKGTGDRMVLLVTGPGKLPKESFLKAVLDSYPATTVLWGVTDKKSDVARTDKTTPLHGPGFITEKVLGRSLRISPYTFFQTNTNGASELYSMVREWLKELKPKNILDLYCGSGGITLCVADLAERVMGVEVIASAVEDARFNAGQNKIKNAEFMESKVEDLLPMLAAQNLDVDTVILDPPRSGLHPAAVEALKKLGAASIIYVSCNPKSMAEDVRRLAGFYELERAQAIDLFPHTDHVEALVRLKSIY
ncbi:MAG: 23S rRNA (uracil(1939)-C(5))-methyltransferase RlmD [Elusimicrobia bacterium]|nr:23S rRNA (uracil(1939)-C(5))-methyltransferase RlmD [Elusimicrobiota bacterium]